MELKEIKMGLQLTLPKTANSIGTDFIDAYWVIQDLRYESQPDGNLYAVFWLNCYPDRDASKLTGQTVPGLGIGRPMSAVYDGKLYEYLGVVKVQELFPESIPVSSDAQKTVIYNWIKAFTRLPFEDVLEEEQTDVSNTITEESEQDIIEETGEETVMEEN